MSYTFFIDESGNTGGMINEKGYDFSTQPIFILASIGYPESQEYLLGKQVKELVAKYKGDKLVELKNCGLKNKKPFIFDLLKLLQHNKVRLYVRVVDKKYFYIQKIINSIIPPLIYFRDNTPGCYCVFRAMLCTILYTNKNDFLYDSFFEFTQKENIQSYNKLLFEFKNSLELFVNENRKIKELNGALYISNIVLSELDRFIELDNSHKTNASMLGQPFRDLNQYGKEIIMLIENDALAGLLSQINHDLKGNCKGLRFIHDIQPQFSDIIAKNMEYMSQLNLGNYLTLGSNFNFTDKIKIEFDKSDELLGIQIADIISRFYYQYYCSYIKDQVKPDSESFKINTLAEKMMMLFGGNGINVFTSHHLVMHEKNLAASSLSRQAYELYDSLISSFEYFRLNDKD
ncbi:DUF3800 domain-containing protein [Citrobacter sp. BDA59-3]|uniref:DUF3800 domain-containing protein n=1 Tax=Citrobacter sp. BDA59-3 TaxID=2781952 RepID=UPI00187ED763|nr:DUF3800 domain-containing protein [Citrobacter sp. BDA59-3]QOV70889.1 DUF3800 domain-containing protein [Citrobacter sp. BDA59-3]